MCDLPCEIDPRFAHSWLAFERDSHWNSDRPIAPFNVGEIGRTNANQLRERIEADTLPLSLLPDQWTGMWACSCCHRLFRVG